MKNERIVDANKTMDQRYDQREELHRIKQKNATGQTVRLIFLVLF